MVSTIMTPLFLLVILLSFVIVKCKRKSTSMNHHHLLLPPGSCGWPIIGETIEYFWATVGMGKPDKFMKDRKERYKSEVFKTSILGERIVVFTGPAANKFLYTNENNKLLRTWWHPSVEKLLGTCLVTTLGDEGKTMKKMIMANFVSSPNANANANAFPMHYIKTMNLAAQQHIRTHWQDKEVVKVYPTIKRHWFEVVCRLFMSLEDADQIAQLAALFRIFLKGIISIPVNFPGTRFYRTKRSGQAIKNLLLHIVRQRRAALALALALAEHDKISSSPRQDLLSHLITSPDEHGRFLPELVIVNNLHMMIMAGHDVSASAMTVLMKKLAQFPEIYDKVLREHKEISSSKLARGESESDLQWEDIQKMRYSWNVVCEAMRVTPPILGAFRVALADINYEGYHIPKGWKLYWSTSLTHSDPKVYPDYHKFDPSRFHGAGPVPFSFIPFGGGPRMCLGKEFARVQMLIFLHNVITRFSWKLVVPDEKMDYDPVWTPAEGLPIRLHTHQSTAS